MPDDIRNLAGSNLDPEPEESGSNLDPEPDESGSNRFWLDRQSGEEFTSDGPPGANVIKPFAVVSY
jgi:hypothetical protein